MDQDRDMPDFAQSFMNLASPLFGTEVVFATDDFFAAKERMISDSAPIFVPDQYDDHGKWMDGWESRRKRGPGHDHALVRLGVAGKIEGVNIDTSHFTGNFPPAASVEACFSDNEPDAETSWTEIVSATTLKGDSAHYIKVDDKAPYNWLRLNIYPDGGVARFRVYGTPYVDWSSADKKQEFELTALANGGRILGFSDAHYGNYWSLLSKGRGKNMGDGWETRRRRSPGNDWIVIALGHPGIVERVEVDTAYFKGNFPDKCSIAAANMTGGTDSSIITQSLFWETLLPPQKLQADHIHTFKSDQLAGLGPVSHIRLNIFPDGGVSRLRLFGRLS